MTDAYSKAAVGYERIQEVLGIEREVRDLPGARKAPQFRGDIEFENVSFSYQHNKPTLTDVSFKIEPGQVAALVGPTGAGKTTVINLIPRFYDPSEGVIKIDGTDVRRFQQKSLREQISFVLQDTLLFHGPIWQNIAYGKPDATRKEILRAAELANASEFIEKMPEGYDTLVGERGVMRSLRRTAPTYRAIARAVIRNTPILILDEPSSERLGRSLRASGLRRSGSLDGRKDLRDCGTPIRDHSPGRHHLRGEGWRHCRERHSRRTDEVRRTVCRTP